MPQATEVLKPRTGENHRIAAPSTPPSGAEEQRLAKADRPAPAAGHERRRRAARDDGHMVGRVHAAELAVVDERLADRRIGDVEGGHRRVGDELLQRRKATRHERRAGRRQGNEQMPTAPRDRRDGAAGRRPRRVARLGEHRADQRADAAHGGDQANRRRVDADSSKANRNQVALKNSPHRRAGHRRRRAPAGSGWRTSRSPSAISRAPARDRLFAVAAAPRADRAEEQSRGHERERVDEDRNGPVRSWTRKPPTRRRRTRNRGRRRWRRSPRRVAGAGRSLAGRRGRRCRRRWSARRRATRPTSSCGRATASHPARCERDRRQQRGPPTSVQIITGRRRSRSTQAPATRPTSSPATRSMLRTSATSNGVGLQGEDRDERQCQARDQAAEYRDRRRRPDAEEGAVAPERGARAGCARWRSIRRGGARAIGPAAASTDPALHSARLGASELAHHPDRPRPPLDPPGPHHPTES